MEGGRSSERAPGSLELVRAGAVGYLTLNRPESLNAIDREMALKLQQGVRQASTASWCRCLVITGSGRAFCAGQSLEGEGDRGLPEASEIRELIEERYIPLILAMRSLELPIVAAVNGPAVGAGLSLALAADIRVASESAWFSCGFSRLGLIPDAGASYFLPALLGSGRALHYALTGEKIAAPEALTLGLVTQVLPPDRFARGVDKLAENLAAGPTRGFGLTKRAINAAQLPALSRQLRLEADLQQRACQTDDFAEGLSAFLEKRPPVFRGS